MRVKAVSLTQQTQRILFLTENNASSTRVHFSLVHLCLSLLVSLINDHSDHFKMFLLLLIVD